MQSQQKDNTVRQERPPKVEKVPLKLSATKKVELPLAQHPSEIAEPLVIAITCGSRSTQLVISRPIGVTRYDKKTDWVITPIEEVESAIAFAEDPSKSRKDAAKQKLRSDTLVGLGEYIIKDGKMYLKDTTKWPEDIAKMKANANAAYNEAKAAAKEEYLLACAANKQTPKRDWKYGIAPNHFLDKEFREHEASLEKKLEAVPTYVAELKKLDNYETLVGANRDQKQRKLYLAEDLSQEQLVDIVKKKLIHVLTFVPSPPKEATDDKSDPGNKPAPTSSPPMPKR
jgi:hypothetical protein